MRRGDIPCRQTKGLLELMIGPCPSCLARPRQRRALGHGHRLSSTAVGAQVVMETAQRCSPHIHVPHRVAPPRTHIASPTMSCVSVYLRKLSGRSLENSDTVGPRKPRSCSSSGPPLVLPRRLSPFQSVGQNIGPGDAVPQNRGLGVQWDGRRAFCSTIMTWRYDTHPSFASRSQLGQATLGLFVASPVAASVSVPMHCATAPTATATATATATGHGPWRVR